LRLGCVQCRDLPRSATCWPARSREGWCPEHLSQFPPRIATRRQHRDAPLSAVVQHVTTPSGRVCWTATRFRSP